jgi:hypothetical protein
MAAQVAMGIRKERLVTGPDRLVQRPEAAAVAGIAKTLPVIAITGKAAVAVVLVHMLFLHTQQQTDLFKVLPFPWLLVMAARL